MNLGIWKPLVGLTAAILLFAGFAQAAPVIGDIAPVGVYKDTPGAFGLAYDPGRDVMWYTALSGSSKALSIKPWKNFTAAEIAAMPVVHGLPVASTTDSEHASLETPLPSSGQALGFDTASGKLVMNNTSAGRLRSFDPITGANVADFGFGEHILTDGTDVDGGNQWHSRDGFTGLIHKNGAVFATEANAAQTFLPGWSGAGPSTTDFWSGVEQIGDSLYAVAVQTNSDVPNSRTIVKFDVVTGVLEAYDPDGYTYARRWEDLAYDGRYLYAADLRGNEFGGTGLGQIFVFDLGGGLNPTVPLPSAVWAGLGLLGLCGVVRRVRKRKAS
jgi:hypothetical protein